MLPDKIHFSKLNSAGNDFICLDNTTGRFARLFEDSRATSVFARFLCRRGLAVGADGLIVANQVDDGNSATIVARFLEPDGSEARLCGNGAACFAYWSISENLVPGPEVTMITRAGTAQGRLIAENSPTETRVCIPKPTNIEPDIRLETEGRTWILTKVDIGVPHAIAYVEDLENMEVNHWGALIRHHPRFQPHGVNANFVQLGEPGKLAIRTFEFGVENETLACGTGSAAAAIVSCLQKRWGEFYHDCEKSVEVLTRGGDRLKIWFTVENQREVDNVCMESHVRPVYQATLRPEFHRELEDRLAARE